MYIIVYRYITYILYHPISNVFLSDFSRVMGHFMPPPPQHGRGRASVSRTPPPLRRKKTRRIHGEFMALDTQKNEVNLENN